MKFCLAVFFCLSLFAYSENHQGAVPNGAGGSRPQAIQNQRRSLQILDLRTGQPQTIYAFMPPGTSYPYLGKHPGCEGQSPARINISNLRGTEILTIEGQHISAQPGVISLNTTPIQKCQPYLFHATLKWTGGTIAFDLIVEANQTTEIDLDSLSTSSVDPQPPPAPPSSGAGADSNTVPVSTFEQQIVDATNRIRARFGLRPLAIARGLMQNARAQSAAMAAARNMAHQLIQNFAGWRGENIAWNQPTPEAVVQSWFNSPGHRANMLNPNFTTIGVAESNRYWTQQFR